MFVDYVALMLINMTAGLVLLALFVYKGLDDKDQRRWVPGFAMVGLVALVTGLHMIWNWPLPGSFNISFWRAFGAVRNRLPRHGAVFGSGLGSVDRCDLWFGCRAIQYRDRCKVDQPQLDEIADHGRYRIHPAWSSGVVDRTGIFIS